jgi:hypothetical protein
MKKNRGTKSHFMSIYIYILYILSELKGIVQRILRGVDRTVELNDPYYYTGGLAVVYIEL